MSMDVGDHITGLLHEAYGPLPPMRWDTPLSAVNFQPSDAVVISYLAGMHNLRIPSDSDFTGINTVGELQDVLTSAITGDTGV